MIEFGEKLKSAREAKGLTQKTIADMVFVSRQTISRYENGERYPDLLTLKKLARILEVSIDYLLDESEMPKVVEKNPVIENPVIKNLVIVLYATITITYIYLGINDIPAYPVMLDGTNSGFSNTFFNIQFIAEVAEIFVFIYGFIMALKDKLNSKKTGIVAVLFLLFEALKTADYFIYGYIAAPLLIMLPYIAGAIASYCFYIKKNDNNIFKIIIILSSIYGMGRAIYSAYSMLLYVDHLYTMMNSIAAIMTLLIYVLFIYQMLVLDNRRKLLK